MTKIEWLYEANEAFGPSMPHIAVFLPEMAQLRRDDAGNTGETFYQVTLEPHDWYKWFQESQSTPKGEEKDDSGGKPQSTPKGKQTEEKDDSGGKATVENSGWTKVCSYLAFK